MSWESPSVLANFGPKSVEESFGLSMQLGFSVCVIVVGWNAIILICLFCNSSNPQEDMLLWWAQKWCVGSTEVSIITVSNALHAVVSCIKQLPVRAYWQKGYISKCKKCNKTTGICNKHINHKRWHSKEESVASYVKWQVSKQVEQQLHSWALTSHCFKKDW